jgi:hypothetical protein
MIPEMGIISHSYESEKRYLLLEMKWSSDATQAQVEVGLLGQAGTLTESWVSD